MFKSAVLIRDVVDRGLGPALRRDGYRRSSLTWRRTGRKSISVVNVQGSAWNSGADARFTVNLGAYFPGLVPYLGAARSPDRPTEADCHARERIGLLMPDGSDHWWSVNPATDLAGVAGEVVAMYEAYGAPWLAACADLEAARPALARWYAHGDAAVSLALGDRGDARDRLERAISGMKDRVAAEQLRAWGRQHALLQPAV